MGGTQLVIVYMGTEEEGSRFFVRYGLGSVLRVNGGDGALYKAFGLERGSAAQILGPTVWARGAISTLLYGVGTPNADVRQMPGVFLVYKGQALKSFRHRRSADVPDYLDLARLPESTP